MSDKKIFEWDFKGEELKTNSKPTKQNREMLNNINVFEHCANPSESTKNQKRVFKMDKHHEQ